MAKFKIIECEGVPCPRCHRPMQVREHTQITDKRLRQPYYFRRWFYCTHGDCGVRSYMIEAFKVRRRTTCAHHHS